jgi:hypothetical protein
VFVVDFFHANLILTRKARAYQTGVIIDYTSLIKKNLTVTNTLAYFVVASVTKERSFIVPCNPFQPSLTFVDKARAYLSETPFRYSANIVGFWPYPQTLD